MTLLHPHPALKAISEQASPVDQWMNDDIHRYGALRESYALEYTVLEQATKTRTRTSISRPTTPTSGIWCRADSPTSTKSICTAKFPSGIDTSNNPNYDEFWKKEAWVNQLHASTVPNLNVAGFWDQEDPWGPWQIFRHAAEHDPDHTNFIVAGPWYHGEWQAAKAESIGIVPYGGTKPRANSAKISGSFLPLLSAWRRREAGVAGHHVSDRLEYLAHVFRRGRRKSSPRQPTLFPRRRHAVLRAARSGEGPRLPRVRFRSRRIPCPTAQRPVSPTYPAGDWRTWEVADQRFVDHRPDVLTFVSAPLDHDLDDLPGEVSRRSLRLDFRNRC